MGQTNGMGGVINLGNTFFKLEKKARVEKICDGEKEERFKEKRICEWESK